MQTNKTPPVFKCQKSQFTSHLLGACGSVCFEYGAHCLILKSFQTVCHTLRAFHPHCASIVQDW